MHVQIDLVGTVRPHAVTANFQHGGETFTVSFHRTLRLPEDGRTHALPPSLGLFPLQRIEDYREKVPAAWREHGGIFLPMWQREAMWLSFRAHQRPHAVKVAAGKVNAVSGEPWQEGLFGGMMKQDYLVAPPQPWLDGFNSGTGKIRQFVAMPLGMGYTVEAQVTGKEDVGGLQLLVYPAKAGWKPAASPGPLRGGSGGYFSAGNAKLGGVAGGMAGGYASAGGYAGSSSHHSISTKGIGASYSAGPEVLESSVRGVSSNVKGAEMGLAEGGEMDQKIYPDPHGIETWDVENSGRLFVHIVNSELYRQITGEAPPSSPVTAQSYAAAGYPWFSLWDAEMGDVAPSEKLAGVKTVGQMDQKHGFSGQQDDSPVFEKPVPAGSVTPGGIAQGKEWG